jgi:16S rRNA (adenine1518-N6/adenine1519-N6)-dimethyltransferase
VVSAVVALRPLPEDTYRIVDPDGLSMLVTRAFSQRRKTVRNALKTVINDELLTLAGIDPSARPEQIPIDNWVQLANAFASTR